MPYTPIRGFDGAVSQGASPTALLGITDWSAEIDLEITTDGPFLNDSGTKYKTRGGKDIKGTAKGKVPSGKDANQTDVINALINGTDLNIVLRQGDAAASDLAYTVTIPTAVVNNVKLGQDAKNGATIEFSFEGSGSFTVS
jgi:hypothetical protein